MPVPVQPLSYSAPTSKRPGLIATIGVLSIVIGSLSVLVNLSLIGQAAAFYLKSKAFAPPSSTGTAPHISAIPINPNSMPEAERKIVIAALNSVRPLNDVRRAQLDLILTESGRSVFRLSGRTLTPASVTANVSDAKRLPNGAHEGPDMFALGQGRLELYDDHASFFPTDGSDPIRVSGAKTDSTGAAVLGVNQVKLVLAQIEQISGATINPAHAATLTKELTSPGQQLLSPAPSTSALISQIRHASALPDGQLIIGFNTTAITLDSTGKITSWSSSLAASRPRRKFFAVNPIATMLSVMEAMLCLVLAVYLLVSGILIFRESPHAEFHHRVYAIAKIPIAVLGAVGWAWFWSSFLFSIQRGTSSGALNSAELLAVRIVTVMGAIIGLSGIVYPVFLLIALRTRTVRNFYGQIK